MLVLAQPHNVHSLQQPREYYFSFNNYALMNKTGLISVTELMGFCYFWGKVIWESVNFILQNTFAEQKGSNGRKMEKDRIGKSRLESQSQRLCMAETKLMWCDSQCVGHHRLLPPAHFCFSSLWQFLNKKKDEFVVAYISNQLQVNIFVWTFLAKQIKKSNVSHNLHYPGRKTVKHKIFSKNQHMMKLIQKTLL